MDEPLIPFLFGAMVTIFVYTLVAYSGPTVEYKINDCLANIEWCEKERPNFLARIQKNGLTLAARQEPNNG